jgi:hypothetical protein
VGEGRRLVSYVGIIREGTIKTRALVRTDAGLFYTWKSDNGNIKVLREYGEAMAPTLELEIATERQVVVGRNNRGELGADSVAVEFHGVVQKGKNNIRVLVKSDRYYTGTVPSKGFDDSLSRGQVITIDMRTMSPAREDQIAAGFGTGKLRRASKGKKDS